MGKAKMITLIAASLIIAASTLSCSLTVPGKKHGEPGPLTLKEVTDAVDASAMMRFYGRDSVHVELIARYGGYPLVRVRADGSGRERIRRLDTAGTAVFLAPDVDAGQIMLLKDRFLYTVDEAYLRGLMSRDDVVDAAERLVRAGFATGTAGLDDDEFREVSALLREIIGPTAHGYPDGAVTLRFVGRGGAFPVVNMTQGMFVTEDVYDFEVAGVSFSSYHRLDIRLYDGETLLTLREAHDAGLMDRDAILEAQDPGIHGIRMAHAGQNALLAGGGQGTRCRGAFCVR